MTLLPDRILFTIKDTGHLLSVSRSTVQRLINEGQLTRVHPRPGASRITRESLAALLERAADQSAIKAASAARAQARASGQAEAKQEKKKSLLEKWGLKG